MGPILTFVPETGRKRATHEILAELQTLHAGDLCFGHVIAAPEIVDYMGRQQVVHYFILRDPRDVAVSSLTSKMTDLPSRMIGTP